MNYGYGVTGLTRRLADERKRITQLCKHYNVITFEVKGFIMFEEEKEELLMKMNLQYFAEDDDDATDEEDEFDSTDEDDDIDEDEKDNKDKDVDKDDKPAKKEKKEKLFTRSELASITNKQVNEAVKKALDEERKRSKMTEDERKEADRKELEDAIAEKEREIAKREMRIDVLDLLSENNLPKTFVDFINLEDDIDTNTERIEQLKEQYDADVREAVESRLSNTASKQKANKKASTAAGKVDAFDALLEKYKR